MKSSRIALGPGLRSGESVQNSSKNTSSSHLDDKDNESSQANHLISSESEWSDNGSSDANQVPEINNYSEDHVSLMVKEFEPLDYLDDGPQGEVFIAKNKTDSCTYAIKRIKLLEERPKLEDYVNELIQLEHGNIVRYLKIWKETVDIPERELNRVWKIKKGICKQAEKIEKTSEVLSHLKSLDLVKDGRLLEKNRYVTIKTRVSASGKSLLCKYICIQTQFCDKGTLQQWLVRNKDRSMVMGEVCCETRHIFLSILEGIGHIHLKGFVHGNIKPSNIFFTSDGHVKVGDLGLPECETAQFKILWCSIVSSFAQEAYITPERKKGEGSTKASDVYQLGLLLFELIVPAKSKEARLKNLDDAKNGIFPSGLEDLLSVEFALVRRMLSKNKEDRPSVGDVKMELWSGELNAGSERVLRESEIARRGCLRIQQAVTAVERDWDLQLTALVSSSDPPLQAPAPPIYFHPEKKRNELSPANEPDISFLLSLSYRIKWIPYDPVGCCVAMTRKGIKVTGIGQRVDENIEDLKGKWFAQINLTVIKEPVRSGEKVFKAHLLTEEWNLEIFLDSNNEIFVREIPYLPSLEALQKSFSTVVRLPIICETFYVRWGARDDRVRLRSSPSQPLLHLPLRKPTSST